MGTGTFILVLLLALCVVFATASIFVLLFLRLLEERRDVADTRRLLAAQRHMAATVLEAKVSQSAAVPPPDSQRRVWATDAVM